MTRRPLLLALAAGGSAAVLVPGHRAGLGLALAALLVCGAAPRRRPELALAALLCLTAVLRDAGWVVAVAYVGAVGLASYAVAGGRGWLGAARGAVAAPLALPAGLRALAAVIPAPRLGDPRPVVRGGVVAATLLAVFGGLFASADAAFAQLAGDVLSPGWDLGRLPARLALLVAGAASATALTCARTPAGALPRRWLTGGEWTIALGAVVALFAAFVAVQLTTLFGGNDHVLATAGLTYAEYARSGFAQLLVVAALTLALALAAGTVAREHRPTRLLLGVLLALTLVVVGSALHRLGLYEDAFGFTRLRLAASAIGLWLGALVLAAVARTGPRGAVLVTGAALLALVAVDPDRYIAARNVERFEHTGRIDLPYARSLSADAAGALRELPARLCALDPLRARLEQADDGLGGANVARMRARAALDGVSRCSP